MKDAQLFALLLCLWVSPLAAQQSAESRNIPQPPDSAVPVTLGQSVVALTGPWKFHIGDDPRWADTTFDDSQWETVDLTPTPQTRVSGIPFEGFVTGWQARGHPGYAGFAWYRVRVRISGASGPLTLLGPAWFEGGYQVFVNQRLVGSFGDFAHYPPELYYPNPASFSVPESDYEHTPGGTAVIAFRFYCPADALVTSAMGGMHVPPRIGLPSAAAAVFHVEWETEFWRLVSALAAALMYFFFALLIAMIFAFSRADRILLWPLAACVIGVIMAASIFSTNARWLPYERLDLLINLSGTFAWYFWMLTWWAYFGLQRKRWLFKIIIAVGIIDLIRTGFFIIAEHHEGYSHTSRSAASVASFAFGASSFLISAAIAFLGRKSTVPSKSPLFLALLFFVLPNFGPVMSLLHMRTNWLFFGVQFPYTLMCIIGMLFFFSIVLFQQFRFSMQRQQATEEDLKQAREVQSLLIPREAPQVPGWLIESEYHPARQVGGDFFQVRAGDDGSLLIVIGDVSGKGLQAAMTVSAIIGALRDSNERQPKQVLARLNRVLCGQIGGFVTCSATLVSEDGTMSVANAGHLPPYRNGSEISVPGGLPLGMIAEANYEESSIEVAPGDRLTFLSDGVVEARNAKGDLFGFERTSALTNQSAEDIAGAAQRWGQEDDITVLSLVFAPVGVVHA